MAGSKHLNTVKGMRHSIREEISQGEGHKMVRNRRAYEKAVLDSNLTTEQLHLDCDR